MSFYGLALQNILIDIHRTTTNRDKINKFVGGEWTADTIERNFQTILE